MPPLTPKQIARVDGICRYCSELLHLRAQEAARAQPSLLVTVEGLIWKKLQMLRKIISETAAFGAESYLIADVLVSDDDKKKDTLLGDRGDLSLFWRIASDETTRPQGKDGSGPKIFDLHSYYSHLDESLGRFAELVDYWTWWDLPDAADQLMFDQTLQRREALKGSTTLPEPIIQAYRQAMNLPSNAEVTRQQMLDQESGNCQKIIERMTKRRDKEQTYRTLLVAELAEVGGEDERQEDETILEIASHLAGLRQIRESEKLDPRALAYYSDMMRRPAGEIDKRAIEEYETGLIRPLKKKLGMMLGSESAGPTSLYDYKARLVFQMRKRLEGAK